MNYANHNLQRLRALTLMETIISLIIIAVIFTVLLPQFRNIQNSWASKQTHVDRAQGQAIYDQNEYGCNLAEEILP